MQKGLSRELTNRHVQMIAIGGAIGTGLFLGSGMAIQKAGPAIILAYLLAGIFCFFMMRAIGELILSDLNKSSFIEFVSEYLGEKWEFLVGWTYWLCWESLAMADLTASGIYIKYWFPQIPQWLTALVIIIVLLLFNLLSVGAFGELETWFSSIKILAIVALIVTGIILLLTSAKIGGEVVSLHNLVKNGGFFPKGMKGFVLAMPMVLFAFTGIEMVGLTSGETANPKKDLPKAINTLPLRIGLFYIGSMFVLMCIHPWNEIAVSTSPFVQVFSSLGIKIAAGVINFVVLTAALSACNSAIFSTSRTLFVLSRNKHAAKRFGEVNNRSIPVASLVFSSLILFVIVILNYVLPHQIFEIISGVSTVSFILVWIILVVCHLKYKQAHPKVNVGFPMPFYPVANILTIIFFSGVLLLLLLDFSTSLALLFTALWLGVLLLIYHGLAKKQGEV